jgi:2-polyprenyl-3-methyl-5-hydroxy-6-metoxy-1,4-benzoquinol methylase
MTLIQKQLMNKTFSRWLASRISSSFLLRTGKALHETHLNDWQLGGSFRRKLLANIYLILHDYGNGHFPPRLSSREDTYRGERNQFESWEFQELDKTIVDSMTKPFSFPPHLLKLYSWAFVHITQMLEKHSVNPGAKLLEFGCGMGWLAELLAYRGYNVTGTTIAPIDIKHAHRRIDLIKGRGIKSELSFFCSPMEETHKHVDISKPFDAAFCFEALHHAYDWRESLESVSKCIRPGGYLFLFNEPSTLHTYICHRSAKILKTHEIGFKRKDLTHHLASLGFTDIEVHRPVQIEKFSDFWKPFAPFTIAAGSVACRFFWITARKSDTYKQDSITPLINAGKAITHQSVSFVDILKKEKTCCSQN